MNGGKCRTELLGYVEKSLEGKCPCEMKTKGNA
jgi:hypothetical protein